MIHLQLTVDSDSEGTLTVSRNPDDMEQDIDEFQEKSGFTHGTGE